jgi:hypothetical protein
LTIFGEFRPETAHVALTVTLWSAAVGLQVTSVFPAFVAHWAAPPESEYTSICPPEEFFEVSVTVPPEDIVPAHRLLVPPRSEQLVNPETVTPALESFDRSTMNVNVPPPELLFPELLLLPELLFPDGAWPFQAGL